MEWYWIVLIVIGAILVLSGFIALFFTNKKFRKNVYLWVCEAEEIISGSQMGKEKFQLVVRNVHEWIEDIPYIGKWLHLIFTETLIGTVIEKSVLKMKEALKKEAEKLAEENK